MKKTLLALLLCPLLALAQQYPTKPIRMIVPFPAGGPADIFGRGLAQGMSEQLGQQVIIENVGGVGGVLGVDRALKSSPDGYTLGFNSGSTLSIAPFSFAKLPYDVKKDVGLITLVAAGHYAIETFGPRRLGDELAMKFPGLDTRFVPVPSPL